MKDFLLAPADPVADLGDSRKPGMYERIVKLKEKNPELKVHKTENEFSIWCLKLEH